MEMESVFDKLTNLQKAGLKISRMRSTLLQMPDEPRRVEEPIEGYVKGAGFLCIEAKPEQLKESGNTSNENLIAIEAGPFCSGTLCNPKVMLKCITSDGQPRRNDNVPRQNDTPVSHSCPFSAQKKCTSQNRT